MTREEINQKIAAIENKIVALVAVKVDRFGTDYTFDTVPIKILRAIEFEGYFFFVHDSINGTGYDLTHFETGLLAYKGKRNYVSISNFQTQAVKDLKKHFANIGKEKYAEYIDKLIKRKVLNEI